MELICNTHGRLSPRMEEVLLWGAWGKTVEETAAIIGCQPRTVRAYREQINQRLNTANLQLAVTIAFIRGWLRVRDAGKTLAACALFILSGLQAVTLDDAELDLLRVGRTRGRKDEYLELIQPEPMRAHA